MTLERTNTLSPITPVEVVRAEQPWPIALFTSLFVVTYLTFFVWVTAAVWAPQLGLTYWQLVLPVYTFRLLTGHVSLNRTFKVKLENWSLNK